MRPFFLGFWVMGTIHLIAKALPVADVLLDLIYIIYFNSLSLYFSFSFNLGIVIGCIVVIIIIAVAIGLGILLYKKKN